MAPFFLFGGTYPAVHSTQVYCERGSFTLAVFQVVPPSVLTSIFAIPLSPANAIPAIGTLPSSGDIAVSSSFLNLCLAGAWPGIKMDDPVLSSALLAHPSRCQ